MATSRFHLALANGQAYEVGMNCVQFLQFAPNGMRAIGTQNLNGCTAVAIVSSFCEKAFIGSVKIRQFDQLSFGGLPAYSIPDQGKTRRLLHRFKEEGCRRLDPLSWIPAEVSREELQQILGYNSLQSLARGAPPQEIRLRPEWLLRCLQGQASGGCSDSGARSK
jgi:Protein of unknown function (DUF3723)